MQDFLHNIFSRGTFARTDSPIVSVGGVSSNSATLTYDVLHFDSTGNLLVNNIAPAAAVNIGAVSQSGSWTVVISGGTLSALIAGTVTAVAQISGGTVSIAGGISIGAVSQSGSWTVAISGGTVSLAGGISLGEVSQSGSWTFALSGGTLSALIAGTVTAIAQISGGTLTAIVSAGTVTSVISGGTVTAIVSAGTVTGVICAGTLSSIILGQARTTDPVVAADGTNKAAMFDSLGKQVVLPGAVNDLHMDGQVQIAQVAATALIATPGAGRRIAMQSLLVTGSGSQVVQVIISGGPSSRTFGFVTPIGGFALNAGGAPLYITSASTNLSVALDATSTCNIFASGYNMSN